MMEIEFSRRAQRDLFGLMVYLHENRGMEVAHRVEAEVTKAIALISVHPQLGVVLQEEGVQSRFVVNAHMSLIYEVLEGTVYILAIWQHVQRPESGWTVEESPAALSALPQTRYLRCENPSYGRCRHYHGLQIGPACDATGSRCAA